MLRKVVSSEDGTASLADKSGYYVGGKTGTAESYGSKKNRINTFISIFPAKSLITHYLLCWKIPKLIKIWFMTIAVLRQERLIILLVGILFMLQAK